jgi:molecular chaperone DnaK
VTFDINHNGILEVSAKDKGTGKEQRITITASSGLSESEIDQMVKDAESHAEEDRKKREEIETRNAADSATYAAEKLLKDNEDKVPEDLKEEVNTNVQAVRDALKGEDMAAITAAVTALQASVQKVGEIVYSQSGGQGPTEPPKADGDSEGTVEGEYREV